MKIKLLVSALIFVLSSSAMAGVKKPTVDEYTICPCFGTDKDSFCTGIGHLSLSQPIEETFMATAEFYESVIVSIGPAQVDLGKRIID